MTRKQKRMLIRILIAAVLFLAALITDHTLHSQHFTWTDFR